MSPGCDGGSRAKAHFQTCVSLGSCRKKLHVSEVCVASLMCCASALQHFSTGCMHTCRFDNSQNGIREPYTFLPPAPSFVSATSLTKLKNLAGSANAHELPLNPKLWQAARSRTHRREALTRFKQHSRPQTPTSIAILDPWRSCKLRDRLRVATWKPTVVLAARPFVSNHLEGQSGTILHKP